MKTLTELRLIENVKNKVSIQTAKEVLEIAVESYANSLFDRHMGGSMMAYGDVDIDKILKLITGKGEKEIAKLGEARFKEKVKEQASHFDKDGKLIKENKMKINEIKSTGSKEPKLREEDDLDFFLDMDKNGEGIKTGITDGSAAEILEIFYHRGRTYVIPSGEVENAMPWSYAGHQTPKNIKRWYLAAIKE